MTDLDPKALDVAYEACLAQLDNFDDPDWELLVRAVIGAYLAARREAGWIEAPCGMIAGLVDIADGKISMGTLAAARDLLRRELSAAIAPDGS